MMPPSPVPMSPQLLNAIEEIESICDTPGSRSGYFEYGSSGYKDSIRHFLASSSEVAQLAVQPGNVEDLARIMQIVKRRQVPFAVKGGGHGMAPTFSSTTGIQISMTRFDKVCYDQKTQTVEVGAGCLWDRVYSKLAPTGRNVIGGASADGVGVGGWLLGAGYSLKSNRYGLGIDHIEEYEIVTADGRVLPANAKENSDLYQALRGGANNFGIVTKFVLKTYPQNPTYGAWLLVPGKRAEEVKNAMVDFIYNESRQEACAIAAFRHKLVKGEVEYNISVFCVFDAEKPKRRRDVPFQEFKRLATSGEVWKADPAGWQLGKTELSTKDGSLERVRVKESALPSRKPNAGHAAPFQNPAMLGIGTYAMLGGFQNSDQVSDESDDDVDSIFEEMSFERMHSVVPSQRQTENSSLIHNDSDDVANPGGDKFATQDKGDEDFVDGDDYDMDEDEAEAEADDDDNNSTLFDSESNGNNLFQASANRKYGVSFPKDNNPQRIMITKKVDSMGELNERGRFGCLMISRYTKPLLDKMAEEAEKSAQLLKSHGGLAVIVDAWPVHSSIFDNSPPDAAYPHVRGQPYGPMLAYFRWEDEKDDKFWLAQLQGTLDRIRAVALDLGLTSSKAPLYNNLSLETVSAHEIYRDNMEWLQKVKENYDPTDVMGQGRLEGGHRIPLPAKCG